MGEFFKPQRRKVGVVTLVMACVFSAGWVRSQNWIDVLCPQSSSDLKAVSGCHGFGFMYGRFFMEQENDDLRFVGHYSKHYSNQLYQWTRFQETGLSLYGQGLFIRYWLIVIPLTLLSAWLLLSNPRLKNTPVIQPCQPSAV